MFGVVLSTSDLEPEDMDGDPLHVTVASLDASRNIRPSVPYGGASVMV